METKQDTYWNGIACECRRCVIIVADTNLYPNYWARPFVGKERKAVEVKTRDKILNKMLYIDNEDGHGWKKVTEGFGMGDYCHHTLIIKEIVKYID